MRKTAETIKTIRDSYLAENRQATGVPPLDLVWTGHSAGGAVAALLYAHMMQGSRNQYTVKDLSELKDGMSAPSPPPECSFANTSGQNFAIYTASPLPPHREPHRESLRARQATSSSQFSTKATPFRDSTRPTPTGLWDCT